MRHVLSGLVAALAFVSADTAASLTRAEPKASDPAVASGSAPTATITAPKSEPAASPSSAESPSAPATNPEPTVSQPAPAAPPAPKPITLVFDIDLTRQHMTVREHGKVVGSWPISSGREGYRTPIGTFRPAWKAKMWYSRQYDDAPMPHAVFFNGGIAMHATYATGMLGRPASHGCIRQSPANAARTYALVSRHSHAQTRIRVFGAPRDTGSKLSRRDRREREGRDVAAGREGRFAARTAASTPPVVHRAVYRPVQMRRVVFVDSYGNRRLGMLPANDPRLLAASRRPYPGSGYGW